MNTEKIWNKFVDHLNKVNPLGKGTEVVPHQNMIGSLDKYKKIFLAANSTPVKVWEPNPDGTLPEITINPNRIGLDEAYMQMAEIWAKRSKANRSQVGTLIVKDGQIVSDGYNGMPAGWEDDVCETWGHDNTLVTKPELFHSESNAINKASKKGGMGLDGATIYCTLSPCPECAKLIKQNNLCRVVYRTPYRLTDGLDMLKKLNVEVTHLPYTE